MRNSTARRDAEGHLAIPGPPAQHVSSLALPDHPTLVGWKKAYAGRDSTYSLQNCKRELCQVNNRAVFTLIERL